MTTNVEKTDGTEGFECQSDDTPQTQPPAQEEQKPEESANSEVDDTEADGDEGKAEDKDQTEESAGNGAESAGDDATAEQSKGKKQSNVQKRIDKLVREREQEKRERERLERELAKIKGGNKDKPEKQDVKEPVESDFETYDAYLDALDQFENQSEQEQEEPAKSKGDKTEKPSEDDDGLTDAQKTSLAVLQDVISEADKPSDFEQVALAQDVNINGQMLEALAECDNPVDVMYHLGKNKQTAADIAKMTPIKAAREIAKLDLTVKATPPKPKKQTNAPDPISPVKGSDSQKKSLGEMSFSEFEAADRERNSQRKTTW